MITNPLDYYEPINTDLGFRGSGWSDYKYTARRIWWLRRCHGCRMWLWRAKQLYRASRMATWHEQNMAWDTSRYELVKFGEQSVEYIDLTTLARIYFPIIFSGPLCEECVVLEELT